MYSSFEQSCYTSWSSLCLSRWRWWCLGRFLVQWLWLWLWRNWPPRCSRRTTAYRGEPISVNPSRRWSGVP